MEDQTNYKPLKDPQLLKEYMAAKTDPIQFIFDEHADLFVTADLMFKGRERRMRFKVEVKYQFSLEEGASEWDCTVGNYDLNFFFRTDKGQKGERYKTMKLMMNAIEKGLAKKPLFAKAVYYEMIFNKSLFSRND